MISGGAINRRRKFRQENIRFDCCRDDLPVTPLQRRRQLLERRLERSPT